MYWSPNFLAVSVVFKKQENSQQVLLLLSESESFHINYYADILVDIQPATVERLRQWAVSHKKRATLFLIITPVFLGRFLYFLYQ